MDSANACCQRRNKWRAAKVEHHVANLAVLMFIPFEESCLHTALRPDLVCAILKAQLSNQKMAKGISNENPAQGAVS